MASELKSAIKSRDGLALAKYFKRHDQVDASQLNASSWFYTAIASKWTKKATFEELRPALDALVEACKEEDGEWLFPVLGVFAQRLRRSAGNDRKKLQSTKELFDSIFRTTIAFARKARIESAPETDLPLLLVTELMKIYVRIKSDTMTRSLIGTVEHPTFPPMESFSVARRVVYAYYVGRNCILEGEPGDALTHLTYAWNAIGKNRHERNRRRILEYLVPAMIACGWQPTKPKLVEIEGFSPILAQIIVAIANGNVRRLHILLQDNQDHFCGLGTFVVLSKCKQLALRNLLRQTVAIYRASCDPAEKNKIPLGRLLPAVKKWDDYDEEIDGDLMDHVKCRIINLIASGLVKGYLSLEREVLVASPNDAFPKTSVALGS